jgi:hypothetical protein
VDYDKSGEIEWPEFLLIMRKFYPNKLQDFEKKWYGPAQKFTEFSREDITVFIETFRTYDLDGSGSISVPELDFSFKAMGQGVSKDQLANIIETYDVDRSGEIDWPEFLQIMSDLYKGVALGAKAESKPMAAQPSKPMAAQPSKPAQPMAAQPSKPAQTVPAAAPKPAQPMQTPQPAQPATFAPVKATSSPNVQPKMQVGAQRGNPKCAACDKTVYPIESISAIDKVWHKGCFRCESEGCNLTLTLKTFTAVGGQVFCAKHVPKTKPTQVTDSMVYQSHKAAPKVSKAQGVQKNMRTTFGAGEMEQK